MSAEWMEKQSNCKRLVVLISTPEFESFLPCSLGKQVNSVQLREFALDHTVHVRDKI